MNNRISAFTGSTLNRLMLNTLTLTNVGLVVVAFLLPTYALANEKPRAADKLIKQFDQLFIGEFDNYNQINFETNSFTHQEDIPMQKHARLYVKTQRLKAPKLGKYVYYQQWHSGGKDQDIYRQTIHLVEPNYQDSSLTVSNFKLNSPDQWLELSSDSANKNSTAKITTPIVADLKQKDLMPVGDNCHAKFKKVADSFIGGIDEKVCKVASKKHEHLSLSTYQVISSEGFWHLEEGFLPNGDMLFGREDNEPHKMLRARQLRCWAAFKTDKIKENGEPHWDFFPNRMMHDQGDISVFTTTESEPKSYFIRLKQTIFPAGSRPNVFEMFIHEHKTKSLENYTQALSYTWTNSEANRLGINLRWMQASCSVVD